MFFKTMPIFVTTLNSEYLLYCRLIVRLLCCNSGEFMLTFDNRVQYLPIHLQGFILQAILGVQVCILIRHPILNKTNLNPIGLEYKMP